MQLLKKLKTFSARILRGGEMGAAKAYNLWAQQYDNQQGNLMMDMDGDMVTQLIKDTVFTSRVVVDVGCGTGRHWPAFMALQPAQLLGYDVSQGMLNKLTAKFPQAQTRLLKGNSLAGLGNNSCDIVISTLTAAYIKNIEEAITEWCRVLKPGGDIFITDYHPAALQRGGRRTFKHGSKVVAIKNYIYTISAIQQMAAKLGLQQVTLLEKSVDETVKHYYEQQNALPLYERFKGSPIIYGIHFTKS